MLLGFFVIYLFAISYENDICESKGRKKRKVFESDLPTQSEKWNWQLQFVERRLKVKDSQFEKFTKPKERAALHH